MKTFNLRLLIIPALSLCTLVSAQDDNDSLTTDSLTYEDSHFHNTLSDDYELTYKPERREVDYLNALHFIDQIERYYPDRGIAVVWSSKGDLLAINVREVKCGVDIDYNNLRITERLNCCSKSDSELINYGVVYFQMVEHAKYLSNKYEAEAYNRGLAWRGSGGRSVPTNRNNDFSQGRARAYSPNPQTPSGGGPKKRNVTRSNGSHSGGTTPNNGGTAIRTGHTLTK